MPLRRSETWFQNDELIQSLIGGNVQLQADLAASQREVERLQEEWLMLTQAGIDKNVENAKLQAALDEAKGLLEKLSFKGLPDTISDEMDAFLRAHQRNSETTQVTLADQENIKDHQGE